jgi:hypothetical protein
MQRGGLPQCCKCLDPAEAPRQTTQYLGDTLLLPPSPHRLWFARALVEIYNKFVALNGSHEPFHASTLLQQTRPLTHIHAPCCGMNDAMFGLLPLRPFRPLHTTCLCVCVCVCVCVTPI